MKKVKVSEDEAGKIIEMAYFWAEISMEQILKSDGLDQSWNVQHLNLSSGTQTSELTYYYVDDSLNVRVSNFN